MENMVHNIASKINQDGISKSKTAPLLAETMVTHRNAKEHPKNKINQKWPSQLNTNISATSLKLK